MKRNRSIRTLPLDNLNLLKHPLPEPPSYNHERLYFGEEVATKTPSSDDSDLILASVRDLGSKDSSSSLSWGEEYKSEASKKVRDELERMDRVLRGEEPIPENYDREEYEEWMQFFPTLSVLGTKCGIPPQNLVVHPEVVCDKETDESSRSTPKITVNTIDVDEFLKVSPLSSRLSRRQSSSRSLISSQISSSKWLKDEEYDSLPFLTGARRRGAPKSILKNTLVLPPIETNQFRSISATPRRESKSLSVDQKYSGFKRKV